MATAADLVFRRSTQGGGAYSYGLGGVRSATAVLGQTITVVTPITGVTAGAVGGATVGVNGSIFWDDSESTLAFKNGGDASYGPAVEVLADGSYVLEGDEHGVITVTVVFSSLPGSDATGLYSFSHVAQEMFKDITRAQAVAGAVEYHCFYVMNNSGSDTYDIVRVFIRDQPSEGDALAIALDLAGVGDGTATGVADTIALSTTAPSPSLTFTAPSSAAAGLEIASLGPGDSQAVWIRRTVPEISAGDTEVDLSVLGFALYF